MTQDQQLAAPEWTLSWRLRRALNYADVSVQEMADELGVGRTTVSGWLNDPERRPRRAYLRVWAQRCRVPFDWLERGELPRVDSNHQPADWWDDLANWQRPASEPAQIGRGRATRDELLALTKAIPISPARLHQSADHPSPNRAVARSARR